MSDITQQNRPTVKIFSGAQGQKCMSYCCQEPLCQQHTHTCVGPYLFFSLLGWRICSTAGSDTVVTATLPSLTASKHKLSTTSVVYWESSESKSKIQEIQEMYLSQVKQLHKQLLPVKILGFRFPPTMLKIKVRCGFKKHYPLSAEKDTQQ